METQCNEQLFTFQAQNRRDVVATFDGGTISTDGGALLLQQVEQLPVLSQASQNVSPTTATKTSSNTPSSNWLPSVHTPWHLATKTSTTTINCVIIRCLPYWPGREIFTMAYRQLQNLRLIPLRC